MTVPLVDINGRVSLLARYIGLISSNHCLVLFRGMGSCDVGRIGVGDGVSVVDHSGHFHALVM